MSPPTATSHPGASSTGHVTNGVSQSQHRKNADATIIATRWAETPPTLKRELGASGIRPVLTQGALGQPTISGVSDEDRQPEASRTRWSDVRL